MQIFRTYFFIFALLLMINGSPWIGSIEKGHSGKFLSRISDDASAGITRFLAETGVEEATAIMEAAKSLSAKSEADAQTAKEKVEKDKAAAATATSEADAAEKQVLVAKDDDEKAAAQQIADQKNSVVEAAKQNLADSTAAEVLAVEKAAADKDSYDAALKAYQSAVEAEKKKCTLTQQTVALETTFPFSESNSGIKEFIWSNYFTLDSSCTKYPLTTCGIKKEGCQDDSPDQNLKMSGSSPFEILAKQNEIKGYTSSFCFYCTNSVKTVEIDHIKLTQERKCKQEDVLTAIQTGIAKELKLDYKDDDTSVKFTDSTLLFQNKDGANCPVT